MAFNTMVSTDYDAKSPISDDVMDTQVRNNIQWIYDMLSDGATAGEDLDVNAITASKATGYGLTVVNDALIQNDLDVTGTATVGTLTAGVFYASTDLLFLSGF